MCKVITISAKLRAHGEGCVSDSVVRLHGQGRSRSPSMLGNCSLSGADVMRRCSPRLGTAEHHRVATLLRVWGSS
jgi:hypothetical protein